jgi:hypothetical protein
MGVELWSLDAVFREWLERLRRRIVTNGEYFEKG